MSIVYNASTVVEYLSERLIVNSEDSDVVGIYGIDIRYIDEVTKIVGKPRRTIYSACGKTLVSDTSVVHISDTPGFDSTINVTAIVTSEDQVEALRGLRKATVGDNKCSVSFSYFTGYSKSEVRKLKPLNWEDISANYPHIDRLGDVMRGAENTNGRLLLWYGPPGTGKTYALRCLLTSWECAKTVVTDPVALTETPAYLLDLVMDTRLRHLIVIEDGLCTLHEGTSLLAPLLNITDGIIGEGTDVYILVTTNQDVRETAPALLRPGRCIDAIEFSPMKGEHLSKWRKDHDLGPTTEQEMTLAELYAELNNVRLIDLTNTNNIGFR